MEEIIGHLDRMSNEEVAKKKTCIKENVGGDQEDARKKVVKSFRNEKSSEGLDRHNDNGKGKKSVDELQIPKEGHNPAPEDGNEIS